MQIGLDMCYGTRVVEKVEQLQTYYNIEAIYGDLDTSAQLTYKYANGFSHPNMWIIPQEKPNNLIPVMWGLIPGYKKDVDTKEYYKETIRWGSGLNAKSEKLFESNNYKSSALTRRCIVPVNGFYEPHRIENVKKPYSIPFYFERKDKSPFNLAGIYAVTGKRVTFTILTKEATPMFAKIHNKKNRRPVLLQDDDINVWLDNSLNQLDVFNVIEDDMPDSDITAWPISKNLYKKNSDWDREDIINKIHYEDLEITY